MRSIIDRILVVDCPEEEQVRRVVTRSGLTPDEVRAIMVTQVDRAQRLAAADDIIDNSGALTSILPQVRVLDRSYRELAARAR
jgi:dephospho-CoA kinase